MSSIYQYIHEYDYLDIGPSAADELYEECVKALFEYDNDIHALNKTVMFEGGNYDTLMTEATNNIFAKIGKAIADFVAKIVKYVKETTEKVFGNKKKEKREADLALAKKFLSSDDETSRKILKGLEDGEYTMKDLSQFSNDFQNTVKLIQAAKEQEEAERGVNKFIDKIERSAPVKLLQSAGRIGESFNKATSFITTPLNVLNNIKKLIPVPDPPPPPPKPEPVPDPEKIRRMEINKRNDDFNKTLNSFSTPQQMIAYIKGAVAKNEIDISTANKAKSDVERLFDLRPERNTQNGRNNGSGKGGKGRNRGKGGKGGSYDKSSFDSTFDYSPELTMYEAVKNNSGDAVSEAQKYGWKMKLISRLTSIWTKYLNANVVVYNRMDALLEKIKGRFAPVAKET